MRRPLGAEPGLPLDPPKLAEQFAVRVAGARALDLRAYNPVAAVARDRRGAKLRNEQAADGVRRIRTDTGLEPEFRGGVQQKGLEHRTRNAAYGQPYRGFESLPLRHHNKINNLAGVLSDIGDSN